jgi:hypothetical protein
VFKFSRQRLFRMWSVDYVYCCAWISTLRRNMLPSFRAEGCPSLTHINHVFAPGNKAAVLKPIVISFFILDVHKILHVQ